MRTRPIYKIGAIVLSIVLIACGTGSTTDEATSDKINVLATTPMLGDFVNQIGGENINLTILMPPKQIRIHMIHHLKMLLKLQMPM